MNKTKKKLLREIEEQPSFQGLDPTIAQGTNQPQNISLDAKVDRFLIQYEKESAPAVEPNSPPVVKTEGVKGLKSSNNFCFKLKVMILLVVILLVVVDLILVLVMTVQI